MQNSETIVLKRDGSTIDGIVIYSKPGSGVTVYLHRVWCRAIDAPYEIKVTIEPVQTREERLREARIAGLKEFWRTTSMSGSYDEAKIIAVIERVDAEFAKENP